MTPLCSKLLSIYAHTVSQRTGRPWRVADEWARHMSRFIVRCRNQGRDPEQQLLITLGAMTEAACRSRFKLAYPPAAWLPYGTEVAAPGAKHSVNDPRKLEVRATSIEEQLNLGEVFPEELRISAVMVDLDKLTPLVRERVEHVLSQQRARKPRPSRVRPMTAEELPF